MPMSRVTFFIAVLTLLFSFPLFSDTQHVVAKGETLYSISRKYGVTVNEYITSVRLDEAKKFRKTPVQFRSESGFKAVK
jgi:hypothetical protein